MQLADTVRSLLFLPLIAAFVLFSARNVLALQSDLPLDQAARDGNVSEVKRLLELGADPNGLNKWGLTALTGASGVGAETDAHTQIVRLLLAHGADVNRRVAMGTTALNEAAFAGNEATVRTLVDAGADPNVAKDNGWTPLHSAATNGSVNAVRMLLQNGADPNPRNYHGQTPHDLATKFGHRRVADTIASFVERADSAVGTLKNSTVLEQTQAELLAEAQTQLRKDFPGIEFNEDGSIVSDSASDTAASRNGSLRGGDVIIFGDPNASNSLPKQTFEIANQTNSTAQRSGSAGEPFRREGYTTLDYVLSFVITWIVVLVPPLLIRAVRRSPLSKGWAITVCILFWCVNIVVFIALGSTSKSHAALVLGAYFSYLILRKPAGRRHGAEAAP